MGEEGEGLVESFVDAGQVDLLCSTMDIVFVSLFELCTTLGYQCSLLYDFHLLAALEIL